MGYKQVIVVRKDLQMSPGKLAAQASHISGQLRGIEEREDGVYGVKIEKGVLKDWLNGTFTKVICEAKNRGGILKAERIRS